jgi:hypothetical protein
MSAVTIALSVKLVMLSQRLRVLIAEHEQRKGELTTAIAKHE